MQEFIDQSTGENHKEPIYIRPLDALEIQKRKVDLLKSAADAGTLVMRASIAEDIQRQALGEQPYFTNPK